MESRLDPDLATPLLVGAFEGAPDALLIVDGGGRIVLANRTAADVFGYTREALLQLTVEDLVPPAERSAHVRLRATFSGHAPRRMGTSRSRLWALCGDGTRIPVEISLSPLHTAQGRFVVAAVRDVTGRVRAEEERSQLEDRLRQAQKLEALGTLAGGIAHDFNNLLAVIVGNLELVRAEVGESPAAGESLRDVAVAVSRAQGLVEQILAFSRRRVTHRSRASLRSTVEEVGRFLRATQPAHIEVVAEIRDDSPEVVMDPVQMHQVLMNLGTNAAQAIQRPTGRVTVNLDTVSVEPSGPAPPGLSVGRYARLRVSDDGCGMDAATLERIFEPFYTTKGMGHGTGLGLAVVHGIVADHAGVVTVDSAPGVGTTFSVYLPEATSGLGPAPALEALGGSTARVLLIDDEETLLRTGQRLLERLGYRVSAFLRPADALEAIRADPSRFDVVVTDLSMPEMGGLELARAVARLRPDLPVVLTSGNAFHSGEPGEVPAQFRYHVPKPYSGESLSRALELALRGR